MIPLRSNIVKLTSFSFLVIALVLITLILAESPKVIDLKLLPNSSSSLVPKSIKEKNSTGGLNLVPTADAQQPNPNAINYLNNQQTTPNYPSLIGLLAPTLLPGLNSAEQQITPYQLRNASPQQLQRLRQLQELQQRQRGGGQGVAELLGSFLPGGQNSLLGTGINPQNRLNNQNPGTLAQLLGLSPGQQQPANLNNNLNNQARANVYGQPNQQQTPNANLRASNDQTSNDNSNDNSGDNANDNSSDSNEGGEGGEDNSGNESGGENQSNQPDPSQDPDMQQFQNLQGNDNFPGDLFPTGILSEGDLKDIQKSMEEQQKKDAERQRQEAEQGGNGGGDAEGGEGDGNTEGENSDNTDNSDNSDNTDNSDQSGDDQTNENAGTDDGTNEENANQAEDPQDNETNVKANDVSKDVTNNGKLNANDKNSGYIVNDKKVTVPNLNNVNGLSNKLPVNRPGYSYNNLRPNNYKNVNSNVQYEEDDRRPLNNLGGITRQPGYSSINDLPINRFSNNQRGSSYNSPDDYSNRLNRPMNRFNDFRNENRLGNLPMNYNRDLSNDPYASPPYNSQVDYTPEYNQDGLYNNPNSNSDSYNPMSNYRPNQLLSNHLNRQHGDINNFNYRNRLNGLNNRLNRPNYLNNRNLDRNSLGNERSAVNYEPE